MGIEFTDIGVVQDTLARIPYNERRSIGMGFAQSTATLERLYSIALFDLESNEVIEESALDPAERTKAAEYFFRVPPKVHDMHEPFATQITPTQNGGRFIESHGSLIKEIRVQGTTGFRPDATARMVQNATSPDMLRTEATGFDDIIFLKNLFRFYSDRKHDILSSSSTIMVWRNVKDGEYWVVEPMDFRVSQSSSAPLTYEYDFQLKTISRLSQTYALTADPLAPLMSERGFQSRMNDYTTQLMNAFTVLTDGISTLRKYGVDAVNTILRPVLGVLNGLRALKHSVSRLVNFVTADVFNVALNVWDAFARLGEDTDNLSPRRALRNALKNAGRVAARILSEEPFRQTVNAYANDRKKRLADAYKKVGTPLLPNRGASRGATGAFVGDQVLTGNVSQDYVHDGEDIRSLAARLLGSRARWHSLVVLNDLRAPYVSADGGDGVLRPGDPILYPSRRGARGADLTRPNQSTESSEGIATARGGPVVEAYGRDIRLQSHEVSSEVELTDLAVSQRGDIETIAGIPNVDQAVRLKFATEQGSLTVHPTYGARYAIGTRATPSSFNTFRINAESTLRSDRRISNIDRLSFVASGDVLTISARLRLINQADELVTTIDL